mgnify:CR=1 FL=1
MQFKVSDIASLIGGSVEGNGNTLYLGGTIHVLREADYPLPLEFDSAYSLAETIVLEADLNTLNDSADAMMKKFMYPEGQGLSKNLSPGIYELLKTEF